MNDIENFSLSTMLISNCDGKIKYGPKNLSEVESKIKYLQITSEIFHKAWSGDKNLMVCWNDGRSWVKIMENYSW